MISAGDRRPGLVIIHVDGLSHARLRLAVDGGHMPFVARLLRTEGYEALAYRCGVPSTTGLVSRVMWARPPAMPVALRDRIQSLSTNN